MNRKKREQKRKQWFVDRQVQGAIIIQVVRHWLLFFVGVFIILTVLQELFGDVNRSFMDHVRTILDQHAPLYLIALCMLPTFINDMVKLSHRFVGPVLRVRTQLRRLADGQPVTPITLRKNDFWHGLAADFNAALATIDRDLASVCVAQPADEQLMEQEQSQLVDSEV